MRANEAQTPHCLVNICDALPVWDDNAGVVLFCGVVGTMPEMGSD